MSRRLCALLLLAASLASAGCTQAEQDRDRLLGYLDRTEQLARTFSYVEIAAGHRTEVTGTIHDDFRYSESISRDGLPAADAVVYDDDLALRVRNLDAMLAYAGGTKATAGSFAPALTAGQWVVDPTGSNSLTAAGVVPEPGRNPFLDALVLLEYARRAIIQSQGVQLWNPQSEGYRPQLDPFPKPAAGVIRYDLIPPDLPPRQQAAAAGASLAIPNQVPGVPFFRLMAFYIKDGLVQTVRESVSVDRRLGDSQSNLQARLSDYIEVPQGATTHLESVLLLRALDHTLAQTDQPLIRPREMVFALSDLGRPHAVTLPESAAQASLQGLGPNAITLYESN